MKVMHVISGLRSGGAEHFLLHLCRHSLKNGDVQMQILTLEGADDLSDKFRASGITLLSANRGQGKKRFASAIRGIKILLQQEAHVVHAHMFHACMVACFAKLFRPGLRILFTLHNNQIPEWHRRMLLFLTRPLRFRDILFPGMPRKWYHKQQNVYIANGVEVTGDDMQQAVKPPLFTCLFAGRLSHEKNPLFLIHLAKSLRQHHRFVISVAGSGPLQQELASKIAEHGLQEYFLVHGYVEDLVPLYAKAHCLVIPSLWEGMPLVLLEAGAMGVPVIATPVGNIPFLLNNGNGYVGTIEEIPGLVMEVMSNYNKAVEKGRNLMRDVRDKYNIHQTYLSLVEVYRQ